MSTPNLGWLYYRELYNDQRQDIIEIEKEKRNYKFSFSYLKYPSTDEGKEKKKPILKNNTIVLKERSQQFFNKKLSAYKPESFFECEATTNSFELTTTYPGLLCGVGYNHGISSESDFKVGFYFDHTTGLPIIPGSSVKGVLRSAFPGYIRKDEDKLPKEEKEEFSKRYDFFRWMIDEVNRKENAGIARFSNKEIDVLEAFIFEGQDEKGEQISYYKRDRFFDAYPVKSFEKDGYFLKNDYITPHINRDKPEMSPFTSPNPIQFLKVLPQVIFKFQFKLEDGGGLKSGEKEALFKEILCFMGAGAKTNVGYGQFALPEINKSGQHPKSGKSGETSTRDFHNANSNITDAITKSSDPVAKKILAQSVWYGLIIGEKGDNVLLSFDVDDEKVVIKKKKNRITGYIANESQKVRIVFKTAFVNDSPDFSAIAVP